MGFPIACVIYGLYCYADETIELKLVGVFIAVMIDFIIND